MTALTDLLDRHRASDTEELEQPYSVRTPGRTWTTFDIDTNEAAGSGTVSVDTGENVEALLLADAYDRYPDKVEQVFFNELDARENSVTQQHIQELADAVFIHIPEGITADTVTVTTTADDGFFPHHVLVYAEDGAIAEIVERNEGMADCDSAFTEVHVGRDAHVAYTKINALDDGTGYADSAATVQANGTVQWLMLSTGSALYRNSITTRLAGPRSSLDYRLGFLAAADQHMDHTAQVIHDADSTRCDMDSRGVVMDEARAVYRGIQQVSDAAGGTERASNHMHSTPRGP